MKIEQINYVYYNSKMSDTQKLNALDDILKVVNKHNKSQNMNNDDLLDSILMMMRVYGLIEYK